MRKALVILVITLAIVVRVWNIELAPPSLNWDEVSHGYNAYSILKTGHDEWGVKWPIIFKAYGDFKLPVYVYLTVASEALFGLSPLSVRLPSVLAGVFTVIFSYLLVKKLFKDEKTAVLSSLLVAIEPWSLFLSRAALEANVALAAIVSGLYFLLLGIEKKSRSLLAGVILLGFSVWTYNSARIFVPLLLLAITLIHKTEFISIIKNKKPLATICILLATVFLVPMFVQLSQSIGLARYGNVQILDSGAIGEIERLRTDHNFVFERLIFNKGTYFAFQFVKNYFSHFSPNFLFIKGGSHYQFSVPDFGVIYLVNAPFFILGLYRIFKNRATKEASLILVWLFAAPIASSLTREAPHVLRSIIFIPLPMVLSAVGINYLIERFNRLNWLWSVYLILVLISFADYFNVYVKEYRTNYSWSWQYGYEDVVKILKPEYANYEKFVITKKYGEPHEFILFYWPWPPKDYQEESGKISYFQSNWYWTDKFDKFYFVNDWDIPKIGSEFVLESGATFDCASCLLVTSPGNAPENWNKLDSIYFLDGKLAFEIYEH